jgi:hydrogenase maturation protease
VLACGEASRGDDGAGLLAADVVRGWINGPAESPVPVRGLLQSLRGHVEIRSIGQLEPDDLLAVADDEAVVVIDTVRGVAPGSIVRRLLAGLASGGPAPRSSHMLPLREALGLAQTLRGSLPRGMFVGLGGSAFELGAPPSAPVLEGVAACAAAVVEEAGRLVRG